MPLTLVFPPPFDLSQPYLSLPVLTGYLRRAGVVVQQRDLNLEFYDSLLTRDSLSAVLTDLKRKKADANKNDVGSRASWERRARAILPTLIHEIDNARSRLADSGQFSDASTYSKDVRYLHRACEAVSALYYPTRLTLSTFSMQYRTSSIADMICASQDENQNPLINFLRGGVAASLIQSLPTFVGISIVYSDQLIPAITIAREIKRVRPVLVVAGGEVISRMARSHNGDMGALFDWFDGIVVDDGAEPLLSLYRSLLKDDNLDSVPCLLTRENRRKPPPRPAPLPSLDVLGRPDFAGLRMQSYFCPGIVMPILSGKGCEWARCTFCTESFSKSFATRSITKLLDDIEELTAKYNARHFTFADSDVPPRRLEEIADGIMSRNLNIFWSCYARLTPQLTPQIIKKMSRAGCRQLFFGFETASQRMLNLMRKGIRVERVPELLRMCYDCGIFTHLFCFVGFPGETRDEAWSTAQFIIQQLPFIGSFNIGAFSFRTFSEIYEQQLLYGITSHPPMDADGDVDNFEYEVAEGMTMDEAKALASTLVDHLSDVMERRGIPHSCYKDSGYIIRGDVPAWQSHALFYLSEKVRPPNTVSVLDVACGERVNGPSTDLRNMVVVEESRDGRIVFCPSSGRVLRVRCEQSI